MGDLEHAAINWRGCIVAASLPVLSIMRLSGLDEIEADLLKTRAQTDLLRIQRGDLSPTPSDTQENANGC